MSEDVLLNHVALQYSDREKAAIFFTKILGIPRVKNFTLSKELSAGIFGINNGVDIDVYDNGRARFEVFISHTSRSLSYGHICIELKDKKEFILRCKKYGLEPFTIKKDGKDLLFVKDFSDYLYEVKEQ